MNESEFKTRITKRIREEGGFGRRIEDQFAVGIPDMLLVPMGGPVFLTEAKIIRASTWAATPRQAEDLRRFKNSAGASGYGIEMGFNPSQMMITIRRIDDMNPENHWNTLVKHWTQLRVSEFLAQAHHLWKGNPYG